MSRPGQVTITIDGRERAVSPKSTLLEIARSTGADIPTMCHAAGRPPSSSCMVCVVLDGRRGRFIPSCASYPEEGMVIETGGKEVMAARKEALECILQR